MIHSKKIDLILKKCRAGDEYKETTIYLRLFIISVFISGIFFIGPLLHFELSTTQYTKIAVLSIIPFFVIFSLYFVYNEMQKTHSIKLLFNVITSLKYGDWKWPQDALSRLAGLHPIVISHSSAMYFLGHLLLRQGHEREGSYLIDRAKQRDPHLAEIQMSPYLAESDAQYFYNSLKNEKRFQRTYSLRQLWNIKIIRYSVIFLFAFFLFLHYLAQILQMFK